MSQPENQKGPHEGYRTAEKSTDKWLSPRGPQTGDGKTRRNPQDKVRVTFRRVR